MTTIVLLVVVYSAGVMVCVPTKRRARIVHYKMCSVLDMRLTFHAGRYYFVTSVTIKLTDCVKDMSNKLLSSVRTYVPLYLREASSLVEKPVAWYSSGM
jgi:hypothetical protein